MDAKEIIKIVNQNLNLITSGYKLIEEIGYGGISITLVKDNDLFLYDVGLWIDGKNSYSKFLSSIYFKEIGEIINPILVKIGIWNKMRAENDRTIYLSAIEPELFQQTLNPSYPKTIETEQDVIDLLKDLNDYTINVAEPFFAKWSDLRVLDKFLDTVPQMDLVDYLGQGATARKAIVYKLCNNPKFDEYFNWIYHGMVNKYINDPNGDISNKQLHDLMIDLKEVLDRTEPVYNI